MHVIFFKVARHLFAAERSLKSERRRGEHKKNKAYIQPLRNENCSSVKNYFLTTQKHHKTKIKFHKTSTAVLSETPITKRQQIK